MSFLDTLLANIHKPLLIAALTFETTRSQRLLAFGVILMAEWYTYLILLNQPGHRGFYEFVQPISAVAAILLSADLLLMNPDPRVSIKQLSRRALSKGGAGNGVNTTQLEGCTLADRDASFVRRALMATGLAFNPRCIGTNIQVSRITPLSPSLAASRYDFCVSRLLIGIMGFLGLLGVYFTAAFVPFVKEAVLAEHMTPFQRAISGTATAYATYQLINSGHCLLSVAAVTLRISDPEEWPDYFGTVSDAYTVGRVWGRCWHQIFRKPFTSIGTWVVVTLGVPPRSFVSRCIYLWVAFALSALVHVPADFVLYHNFHPEHFAPHSGLLAKFSREALFSPQFFLSQAVAIMFEDGMMALFDRVWGAYQYGGSKGKQEMKDHKILLYPPWLAMLGKIIGYIWVYIWFCATLPQFARGVLIHIY